MSCAVDEVRAPDGTRSKLFDQLLQVTASDTEATKLYLNVMSEPLNESIINENGEPDLGNVIHRSDLGFTDKHRGLYSSRDFSRKTKRNSTVEGVKGQIQNAIGKINNRLAGKISAEERETLVERKQKLRNKKNRLDSKATLEDVKAAALDDIEWAKKLLDRKGDLSPNEILLGINTLDAWTYDITSEFLTGKEKENIEEDSGGLNTTFLDIDSEAKKVRNALISQAWQAALDDINSEMYTGEDRNLTLEEIQDMPKERASSFILNLSNYFDMSAEDQRLAQRIDDILKNAKRWGANTLRQIDDELTELVENVDDTEALFQKDEEGNWTGNLINPNSAQYWERHQDAISILDAARKGETSRSAEALRKEGVRTLRSLGEAVDVRYLYDDLDDPGEYGSAEEYRSHLENRVGKDEADRAIRAAKEAWREYQNRKRGFRNNINSEIRNGRHRENNMTEEEYFNSRMQSFVRRQSPIVFLREFYENTSPTPINRGHEHSYIAGNNEYQDDTWNQLTDEQLELANYLRDLYSSLFTILPDHIARRKNENFVPRVKKDVVERFQEHGMLAMFKQMGDEFFEEVTGDEIQTLTDEDSKMPNPFSGLGNHDEVPIRFISDELEVEDMSQDLIKATEMFASMALNYRAMIEVEPIAQLFGRLVEEAVDSPGESGLLESTGYNLDAMLYGERRARREGATGTFVTSFNPKQLMEDKQKKNKLERQYENLKDKWKNDEIGWEEYTEKREELEAEYQELQGKTISPMRLIESTIGRFTMLSGIGYNIQSGIVNGLFGMVAMSVHAAGEQDFTTEEYHDAVMEYFNARMTGSGKAGAMMTNFDILYEISEIAYGKGDAVKAEKDNFVKKVAKDPYFLIRSTETMIQTMTMMAVMKGETVEVTENGETKEIDLWEAFDENGEWDSDRFGENPEWTPPDNPLEKNKWVRMRNKIIQINKRFHGNYDVNSPMDIKKLPLGRLVTMFRTWAFEGFRYRFGKEMPDAQLERKVKGSYRSVYDIIAEHGAWEGPKEALSAAINKDFEGENTEIELDEIDIRNLRKVFKDLKWFLGMSAVMLALYSMTDDDEEDDFKDFTAKSLMNTIFRVRQDITFYTNPATFTDLVSSPIPATRTLINAGRALDGTFRYLTDPEYKGSPLYQWADATVPSKQVLDIIMLLKNQAQDGEYSVRYVE